MYYQDSSSWHGQRSCLVQETSPRMTYRSSKCQDYHSSLRHSPSTTSTAPSSSWSTCASPSCCGFSGRVWPAQLCSFCCWACFGRSDRRAGFGNSNGWDAQVACCLGNGSGTFGLGVLYCTKQLMVSTHVRWSSLQSNSLEKLTVAATKDHWCFDC